MGIKNRIKQFKACFPTAILDLIDSIIWVITLAQWKPDFSLKLIKYQARKRLKRELKKRIKKEKTMKVTVKLREGMENAFWAKGSKIIPVSRKHIDYLIGNFGEFGLSLEDIKAVYKKYKEKLYSEGKAREHLIREVSKDGWVRIRHYNRPDYWSVQGWNKFRSKKTMDKFIDWALDNRVLTLNDELVMYYYETDTAEEYSFVDGGVAKYLTERTKKK